jgi:hypothetical protein
LRGARRRGSFRHGSGYTNALVERQLKI